MRGRGRRVGGAGEREGRRVGGAGEREGQASRSSW